MKSREIISPPILNPVWDIWIHIYGEDPAMFNSMYRGWGEIDLLPLTSQEAMERYRKANPEEKARVWGEDIRLRRLVIDHATFAVPDPVSLAVIATYGPIIEIGAGTGYWAWCLRQMGVDVIAFDKYPPQSHPRDADRSKGRNGWFDTYWTHVLRGDDRQAGRYPDRSLMMVWPYMDDMAIRALKAYRGDTVIYVGEERAACATAAFFDELEEGWVKVHDRSIPQWFGLHDELWILQRR